MVGTKQSAGAVIRRCSVSKVLWKITQNSQENTCAGVSFELSFRHRDIRLMFLSRSTEKQAGHDLYWFIIDLLLIDSKNLAELILCIFFSCISWNMNFFAYLTCIYFRKCRLKKVLRIFKFAKSTKIREKNIRKN